MIKTLLTPLVLFLFSCEKTIVSPSTKGGDTLFYMVTQMSKDGNKYYSPIKVVKAYLYLAPPTSEDTCITCPLPNRIEKFDAYYIGEKKVQVDWICYDDYDVDFYIVNRSSDSKQWIRVAKIQKNSSGQYTYIDKLK